jgi:hypothetical protein
MSRERDEVLDQCREWLNRNLVEGDPALWTNERVRVWFQTNKHRFVPSTVGGTRSDCATQNMRMRLDIRRLGAELRRQYALIDRLESEGASREEVIRRLRHDLALADGEIEELIQENDRLQSELTATRGVLEEILDAEDKGIAR